MSHDLYISDLVRELLLTALMLAGPVLLVGLVVGVAVSLFQALTSVQEQTMALVPKMMAVMLVKVYQVRLEAVEVLGLKVLLPQLRELGVLEEMVKTLQLQLLAQV